MHPIKSDGWAGSGTNINTEAAQYNSLWCTSAITSGDWIAVYAGDTTNPGGRAGDSFRTADADNADAVYDTVGVAVETTTAAGYCLVQTRGYCATANVASSASGALAISATAGRAEDYAGTNPELRVIGTTQAAASGNVASVYLNVHPRFAGVSAVPVASASPGRFPPETAMLDAYGAETGCLRPVSFVPHHSRVVIRWRNMERNHARRIHRHPPAG